LHEENSGHQGNKRIAYLLKRLGLEGLSGLEKGPSLLFEQAGATKNLTQKMAFAI